jgi:hypothetical protein
MGFRPMFYPLELSPQQQKRASLYIEIRDTYHHLYLNEGRYVEGKSRPASDA